MTSTFRFIEYRLIGFAYFLGKASFGLVGRTHVSGQS